MRNICTGCKWLSIKDYSNPDSFSHYINYLLSRPNVAEELGINARKSALNKYTVYGG